MSLQIAIHIPWMYSVNSRFLKSLELANDHLEIRNLKKVFDATKKIINVLFKKLDPNHQI
jgi:hypothetical protein